jgi:hypothetical protein
MTFRRRTYPEVLDNLLTAITGGVSAEAHPFPPPSGGPVFFHYLQQPPAADVISVYGSRDGGPHQFRKDTDYKLRDKRILEWQEGAELPDDGSVLLVNYYPEGQRGGLNDLHVGSITRTLAESFALETARLYAQLQVVYESGFIDLATGRALDNVVALLGIERVSGGRAAGEVEFTRSPNSTGTITIPAGTRVMTADGNVEYATTASITLPAAQTTIKVAARDLEANDPLPAAALTVMPIPIVGVASVTNPGPTALVAEDETDEALRARAKNFLHGSERATLGAIKHAIVRQGVTADVTEVPTTPGLLNVALHADVLPPELAQRIYTAIDESRPAGVFVQQLPPITPKQIALDLRLTTASGLLEQDLRGAQRAVREKIAQYFEKLPVKEAGSINKIVGMVLSVSGVEDVRLLKATADGADVLDLTTGKLAIEGFPTVLGDLHISDPNLPTRLNVTVRFPAASAPPDKVAIQTALNTAITTINQDNAADAPATTIKTLNHAKFLNVTPLPNKAGAAFTHNPAVVVPAVAPYVVSFALVQESGLSTLLVTGGSTTYLLTAFERLALATVELQPEEA